MSIITTPPVTWLGNGWQQKDEIVSVSTARNLHKIQVFNSAEDVRNRFFPNQREVEIGPGSNPILSPKSAFFIEPSSSTDLYSRMGEDRGDMREQNSRLMSRNAGDAEAAQWLKKNDIQVAWMKNMPDLSEDTFSSFKDITHVVDMTSSANDFPWVAIDAYEKFENDGRGARKDHFIAHGFYPIQRIYIPEGEGGLAHLSELSGTIYARPEEID